MTLALADGVTMPHDPLCPHRPAAKLSLDFRSCTYCELINLVREDERYENPSNPFQGGYLLGRKIASLAILDVALRLDVPKVDHYPGCWKDHALCALHHAADIAELEE